MKKIFGIVVAVTAFLASCSSPYYPEYVPLVSLGANTSALVCENVEGSSSLNVISNVEYTASIISGEEWLSFADTKSLVRNGNGNTVLVFNHLKNNHDKRVGYLVLAAETRRDTIKIKQKGAFEDYLEIHPEDYEEIFPLKDPAKVELGRIKDMSIPEAGGEYSIRLRTSCMDHEFSFWTDRPDAIVDVKVVNGVLSFRAKVNEDAQPRLIVLRLSYIDGWDDVKTLDIPIKQMFDPLN